MNKDTQEHKILEAIDIAMERLEDAFYDTKTETWSNYDTEYAHGRLRFVMGQLQNKFEKNLRPY